MAEKKVILVVAHKGFQQIEYSVSKMLFEHSGILTTTASTSKDAPATDQDGATIDVDLTIDEIVVENYNAIIFIGGPCALKDLDNEKSYSVIQKASDAKVLLGAICITPRILAKAGVLTNKRATSWNNDNEAAAFFKTYDVNYKASDIIVDKTNNSTIVTAVGPNATREFAEHIISLLDDSLQ